MHGAGIYRQRYGLDPGLGLSRAAEVQEQVDAFVAEQEAKFGGDLGEHRGDYELLQLYDRLSLYFCMRDVEGGEEAEIQGHRFSPVAPWRVRLDPFPFAESPARFALLRYVLPKRAWTPGEFRAEMAAARRSAPRSRSSPDRGQVTTCYLAVRRPGSPPPARASRRRARA